LVNTVSGADARLLGHLVPKSKLRTILNAPPLSEADVSAGHAAWPAGGTRLLAVGRLVTQKGYDRLLRALATPELLGTSWHLVVVGDGPDRERLTRLSRSLGLVDRVTWIGAVASIPWLRRSDLVLSASVYEGMPLVPLEAMREHSPVLVSDIPPHRELFDPSVPQSLLPRDERDWPQYLGTYITHERCRAELAQAQSALQGLIDPQRQWSEYAALYDELVLSL
jgi:glycosyltransferase involved in cell wall biosynthesis